MKGISYKEDADSIDEALQIPRERVDEFNYRCSVIVHDYFRPTKEGVLPPTDQILKLYIALAENEQELVYLAYMAGCRTHAILTEMKESDDFDFEEDIEDEF